MPEDVINYLSFDLDDTEYEDLQDSEDSVDEIVKLLRKGKLDDVPLFIDLSTSRQFQLPLTFDEAVALKALKKDLDSEKKMYFLIRVLPAKKIRFTFRSKITTGLSTIIAS